MDGAFWGFSHDFIVRNYVNQEGGKRDERGLHKAHKPHKEEEMEIV